MFKERCIAVTLKKGNKNTENYIMNDITLFHYGKPIHCREICSRY